jgi:hypothetical protein
MYKRSRTAFGADCSREKHFWRNLNVVVVKSNDLADYYFTHRPDMNNVLGRVISFPFEKDK